MYLVRGLPDGPVDVPRAVTALAAGQDIVPVWVNSAGGRTFRIGDTHVKWVAPEHAAELRDEVDRLAWAGRWLRVPSVIDHGDDEDGAWMRTITIDAASAVDPRWQREPRTAVIAVAEGLRAMHDTLPVGGCPFTWSTPDRIDRAGASDEAVAALGPEPDSDLTVVCHGDACSPNTLVGADGRWAGHVDLGELGTADRWADIAVATMSAGWNHGPGWDGVFHDAYGIPEDPERSRWYRMLWNLDGGSPSPVG